MTPTARLAFAGFVATAIGFGPARVGFGLFTPQFSTEFGLSPAEVGRIASFAFISFFVALPVTALMVVRLGTRFPVILACLAACAGSVLVATASTVTILTVGIIIAGASAGFCWTPFNDAAKHTISTKRRGMALSIIATGTAAGVAFAGALSLAAKMELIPWRYVWWAFAAAALLAAIVVWFATPKVEKNESLEGFSLSDFWSRKVLPLYTIALVFGATNTIFISFATNRVADTGGLPGLQPDSASAVVFISYGIIGLIGVSTGRTSTRFGLDTTLRTIFGMAALSMVLIAIAPNHWATVVIGSGIHGAALMAVSAVISFWSLRLFPGWGTIGFTAVLIALAIGSVMGPALAGVVHEVFGGLAMFSLAAIPALIIAIWPKSLPELPANPFKPVI